MTIRDKRPANANDEYDRYRRKSNQHWDMAGLARQDNDKADEARHTELARMYDKKARDALTLSKRLI